MQSQLFDQQIHMWRWTGNKTHAPLLRAALALHAEWAEECFDPDSNGLFHSYINTWPTDSVYFNGGETVEETCYAYTAHRALRDLADTPTERSEQQEAMDRIAAALPSLWLPDRGHHAAWREEGGHKRLRADAWLYSVFLPIDAGLLSPDAAAQALHYTEWGLQRDAFATAEGPCGVRVWTSNWVRASAMNVYPLPCFWDVPQCYWAFRGLSLPPEASIHPAS